MFEKPINCWIFHLKWTWTAFRWHDTSIECGHDLWIGCVSLEWSGSRSMIQGHRGSWCIKRTGKSFPAADFLWERNPPRSIPSSIVLSDFVYTACRVTIRRGSASPTSLVGSKLKVDGHCNTNWPVSIETGDNCNNCNYSLSIPNEAWCMPYRASCRNFVVCRDVALVVVCVLA